MNMSKKGIRKIFAYEQISLVIVLIIMCILAVCLAPVFITGTNIMNVLRSSSLTLITSCGMVLILLLGEMDMSVGAVQGLVGVYAIMVLNKTNSIVVTLFLPYLWELCLAALTAYW